LSQTSTPVISVDALDLFTVYQSRADYQAKVGSAPPAFDATRPLQRWFDPAQANANPNSSVAYNYFDQTSGAVKTFAIPASQAAVANISDTWTLGGAPGDDNQLVWWDNGTPPKAAPNPPAPTPIRALNPGESIQYVPVSGFPGAKEWAVVTAGSTSSSTPAPASDDGFTDADRATLTTLAQQIGDIHTAIGQILTAMEN